MNAKVMNVFLSAVVLSLATAGCAAETTSYRTVSEPPQYQTPAASYPIPAGDPKGSVYIMSLGGEPMAAPSGAQGFFLHLRIAAENRSDAVAWTIAAHDQVVTLAGAPMRPTYAQGSAAGPVVTLAQGQHGYLDVFYPLPPQGSPGQATLAWQVHRGSEVSAATTSFEAMPSQSPEVIEYRPVGVVVDYWPAWWWGVGFYYPWWWGPGLGYWGRGYGWGHGYVHPGVGGWRGSAPGRGIGGGGRGWRGMHR